MIHQLILIHRNKLKLKHRNFLAEIKMHILEMMMRKIVHRVKKKEIQRNHEAKKENMMMMVNHRLILI
jgi:hypothetical protein